MFLFVTSLIKQAVRGSWLSAAAMPGGGYEAGQKPTIYFHRIS